MVIHIGRTRPGLGSTGQVALCTDEPVSEPDELTRIANVATCEACLVKFREVILPEPDAPPAASEFGLGLPGAQPRDWTPTEARLAEYLKSRGYGSDAPGKSWITSEVTSPYYAGVGCDELGIFLHPAAWNAERLPGDEETRLAYFFKLVYMERLRQLKKWGDQRHPDGVDVKKNELGAAYARHKVEVAAVEGTLTWMMILREEIAEAAATNPVTGPQDALSRDGEPDLESEMVQSAAVLAAWHSDVCRRVWEAEQETERGGSDESLDEGMRGM